MLRRGLRPLATFATMFALICGGPFGTEEVVPNAGPGLAIAMMIAMAILWALPYSLLVGELASAMPLQGGIYQWFRASLGPFWSFQFSTLDWLTWVLDAALYPPLVAAYLSVLLSAHFGFSPGHGFRWGVCLAVIWFCTWLNIRGVNVVGRFSAAVSLLLMAPVVAIVLLGWKQMSFAAFAPWVPSGQPFSESLTFALVWSLWNYSGYSGLANASEEIVDPERTYPRTLALFLPISVLTYVLPLAVALGATPDWQHWEVGHFTRVALVVGGAGLAALTAMAGQLSALGIFNSEQFIISRMPYAMAREGLLPPAMSRLHPRYGTPVLMLLLQGVFYSALTYSFGFVELLLISTWLALPVYIVIFAAPVVLRFRRPVLRGAFRIPGGWAVLLPTAAIPTLIAVFALFQTLRTMQPRALITSLTLVLAIPAVYAVARAFSRRPPPPDASLGG
jgi:amino acid transporter